MKITIEKVPEGVRVTLASGGGKKPVAFIVQPGQLGMLTSMLQTAMSSTEFRFEMQI